MFIYRIEEIASKNKRSVDMNRYREKVKKKMIKGSKKGLLECRVWLPYELDLDKFNDFIKDDGIECVFLCSNIQNTKYKVHVSRAFDEKFWKTIEARRNKNK